jgi:exonuclease VII small subunit
MSASAKVSRPLALYFSGTNFNLKNDGELIREMYYADPSEHDKIHFKGPGRLGSGRKAGLIDGYADMKKNIEAAEKWLLEKIAQRMASGEKEIDITLAGWSRGAVSAVWCANIIQEIQESMPDIKLNVKLFAVDPVAGPTNESSRSDTKSANIEKMGTIPEVVSECQVTYMEGEGRAIMNPVRLTVSDESKTEYSKFMLPGAHGDGVKLSKSSDTYDRSCQLTFKRAEQFMRKNDIECRKGRMVPYSLHRAKAAIKGKGRLSPKLERMKTLDCATFVGLEESSNNSPNSMFHRRAALRSSFSKSPKMYVFEASMKDYQAELYDYAKDTDGASLLKDDALCDKIKAQLSDFCDKFRLDLSCDEDRQVVEQMIGCDKLDALFDNELSAAATATDDTTVDVEKGREITLGFKAQLAGCLSFGDEHYEHSASLSL